MKQQYFELTDEQIMLLKPDSKKLWERILWTGTKDVATIKRKHPDIEKLAVELNTKYNEVCGTDYNRDLIAYLVSIPPLTSAIQDIANNFDFR